MARKQNKRHQESMLAKIAALLDKPVEEIKQSAGTMLYTQEEKILEMNSVYMFYTWRKKLERKKGESDREWEARQKAWLYKICEGCNLEFAYSYMYDGVKFCSLDCLDKKLKEIGMEVTYGRPLNQRWGYRIPGVVPSAALQSVRQILDVELSDESSDLPIGHLDDLPNQEPALQVDNQS